ncbi:myosin binding protein Ha isoform X2 [Osmerus mordax]|uniref:myosin binding protein Ha isoform X2 n=1 Tax=Osmerus mordax TaxID=8014 RepID=UPI00350F42B5
MSDKPAPPAEEAAPAEAAPAEVPAEAPAEAAPEAEAAPAAPAEEAPAAEAAAAPAEEGAAPAADAPADAAPAEGAEAAPAAEAPAEAAPAEPAPVEEPPKAPTPPPPAEPTSAPLNVTVEDVNDTSLTIKWRSPEVLGDSGLDGYTIEYCKDGATEWVVANAELTVANRLVLKDLTTGDLLNVRVVAVNAGGRSEAAALVEPVHIREVVDRPKIRMPRFLRTRLVKHLGEQINLLIPYNGKPKPVVTWTKNGEPLDSKRANVRNSDKDSILFIRTSQRDDSGVYEMNVKVDSFEDKSSFVIQVVELPGPPASVKLVDTWGFNAALEWTPPTDSGNTEITGYTIQKADKKTGDWFTVLEHYHRLNATISDLIMGNSYVFRVYTENKVGMSEEAAVTTEAATIQKIGISYKPPEYKEHDFSEAPKFTASLNDRAATVGYTTKLLCAVRGSPKPKVMWMKNQIPIGEDPKYRQISNQGVCSLEIRKTGNYDGGVYTCKAKNAHGEAVVACKLEVKQVIVADADKEKEEE